MIASLTRRVSFSAAHRYSRPEWNDAQNMATFGACAWPNFHGHSYVCDVTVSGPIDDTTGFVVDLGVLDKILKEQVTDRFDHRNINLDVPDFADGKMDAKWRISGLNMDCAEAYHDYAGQWGKR